MVYRETLDYFHGDELATTVWIKKYCWKTLNDDGSITYHEKTPDDMHHRLASEYARIEKRYKNPISEEEIYQLMKNFAYIVPQGRPMTGIGTGEPVSISNCFVIGYPGCDSYGTIMKIDEEIAQISKRGGGVGTDLSDFRPTNAKVHNAAMTTTGPVDICEKRFSRTTQEVGQCNRRGALMESMSIYHPDVEKFIDSKMDLTQVTGANISVRMFDKWMEEALSGSDPEKQRIFKKLVHNNWASAEPGILFWDTIINESIPDCYADYGFKTLSTNPCFPGDAKLKTDTGYRTFKELYDEGLPVIVETDNRVSFKNGDWVINENANGTTMREASPVTLTQRNALVYHLVFDNGYEIRCTGNHHFATRNRGMIEAEKLLNVDEVLVDGGKYARMTLRTEESVEDVYCLNEPVTHSLIVNGMVVRNCGEIPLSSKDSCRLMLLNLYSYVENPFSDNPTFNYDKLAKDSRIIMRLMDDMVDLEFEKVDLIIKKIESDPEPMEIKDRELQLWKDIKEAGRKGRRCGVGITAEGDMIAAMNLRYGTDEATEFAVNVHKVIAENVHTESCILASERGSFPVWNYDLEKDNPFLKRIAEGCEEFRNLWKNGRRNIACLTIAPAGSVSLMTQTTSGIECLFMPYYYRKRKIEKTEGVTPDFIDATGVWFEEYFVFHDKFIVWYSIRNNIPFQEAKEKLSKMKKDEVEKIYKQSPYYKAISADVDWVKKVEMQGNIQKYIDHSISVTTNLPKDTDEYTVAKVYETAWKSGCKGCTIYRDGSRDGVLTNESAKKDDKQKEGLFCIENKVPVKRPKILPCKVFRFSNHGEKWVAVIGLMDDHPYEIFTGMLDKLNIPTWVTEGLIIRNKENVEIENESGEKVSKRVSRYDLQYVDKDGFNVTVEGLSRTFNKEYWNYAKMVSGFLRNNMPIQYVINVISGLNLDSDIMNTWANGVVRALQRFIKEDLKNADELSLDICPECGEKALKKDGSCSICLKCGYSKCN